MLIGQAIQARWDRTVLLPAAIFSIQSIPWFTVRLRMRMLAPLMLLFIVIDLAAPMRRTSNRRERILGASLLVSGLIFYASYLVASMLFYGKFDNPWFVSSTFGLFYLWVFLRLAMEGKILEIKILSVVALMALFVGAFMGATYISDDLIRDIIRETTGGMTSVWEARDAAMAGVGGFGHVYSVGLLFPAVIYAGTKMRLWYRLMFWGIGPVFFVYVYRAGFSIIMATLVFGVLSYGLSYVIRHYAVYRATMVAMIVFILMVTQTPQVASFIASPLVKLSQVVHNENYSSRLMSIAEAISGGENEYALYRTSLMWRSWRVFRAHPFGGSTFAPGLLGGHSFFFDYLAMGGLLFFLPYLIFIFCYSRYMNYVVFPHTRSARVLVMTYLYMYLLCTFLNPLNSAIVWASMFMILPGLSLFFSDSTIYARRPMRLARYGRLREEPNSRNRLDETFSVRDV